VAALDDLLVVQDLDTTLDQLQHRRSTLPQLEDLSRLRRERDAAAASADEVAGRLHVIRSAQKEAEDHAALLEDKAAAVNTSMYDGSVVSHKELEALSEEHASLLERQGSFEEQALELMEEADPVEEELAACRAVLDSLDAQIAEVDAALIVARAEVDAETDRVRAERDAAVASVPVDLVDAYEPLRASLGGVAVARLHGARCEGCHLEIPSAQLEQVRRAPEDEIVSCPECFRILVR
jgi:predicted  nucleic acid-binding Zn-ribbon protein